MKTILLSCILVVLCGCNLQGIYTPPTKHNFDKTATIKKNYDDTWAILIAWFAEHDIPFKYMSKADGLIETERGMNISDTMYCDCGADSYGNKYISSGGNYNITIRRIDGNTTSVSISTFFKCYSYTYAYTKSTGLSETLYELSKGESTGQLESEIFAALQK